VDEHRAVQTRLLLAHRPQPLDDLHLRFQVPVLREEGEDVAAAREVQPMSG
jgi:hypothetical protein